LGQASIGRIYAEFTYLQAQERRNQPCPQVLGIDEHTLHRGTRFVTTLCNLKNRKVFDVVEGKSQADLGRFLSQLKDRHRVKVVCMDLSSSYRQLVRRWFPNAKIVSDRFHVIRLVQHHFLSFCRSMVPDIKHRRSLIKALRRNPENLTQTDQQRLEVFFSKHPVIKELYDRQMRLRRLLKLKTLTKNACRRYLPQLMDLLHELMDCGLESMKTLSHTITEWLEEIVRMWRFTRSNGITEGFHRKMKLIQRRAYGFRNFENYRLRVIAQCG
jgi:transposase